MPIAQLVRQGYLVRTRADAENALHRPELMNRIRKSPHDYFRFINTAFAREVCTRFVKGMLDEWHQDIRDAVLDLTELTLAAHRELSR